MSLRCQHSLLAQNVLFLKLDGFRCTWRVGLFQLKIDFLLRLVWRLLCLVSVLVGIYLRGSLIGLWMLLFLRRRILLGSERYISICSRYRRSRLGWSSSVPAVRSILDWLLLLKELLPFSFTSWAQSFLRRMLLLRLSIHFLWFHTIISRQIELLVVTFILLAASMLAGLSSLAVEIVSVAHRSVHWAALLAVFLTLYLWALSELLFAWWRRKRIIQNGIIYLIIIGRFSMCVFVHVIDFLDHVFVLGDLVVLLSESWFIVGAVYSREVLAEFVDVHVLGKRSLSVLNGFDLFHGAFSFCEFLLLLYISLPNPVRRRLSTPEFVILWLTQAHICVLHISSSQMLFLLRPPRKLPLPLRQSIILHEHQWIIREPCLILFGVPPYVAQLVWVWMIDTLIEQHFLRILLDIDLGWE